MATHFHDPKTGRGGVAQPIGWQEEHGLVARFVLWLRRKHHCNDLEGTLRGFLERSGPGRS